jgi:hypothetical protein
VDRRATLVFPPAVLLTALIFATVLAVVTCWGHIRAAGLQESNGDEFRRGIESVSTYPINRT